MLNSTSILLKLENVILNSSANIRIYSKLPKKVLDFIDFNVTHSFTNEKIRQEIYHDGFFKLIYSQSWNNLVSILSSYIMPGIPPPIGLGLASSLISISAHSVVKIIPATEAAFSKATRVTFFGSIIPAANI